MLKCCPVLLTNCFQIGDIEQLTTWIGLGVTETLIYDRPTIRSLTTSEVGPHPIPRFSDCVLEVG